MKEKTVIPPAIVNPEYAKYGCDGRIKKEPIIKEPARMAVGIKILAVLLSLSMARCWSNSFIIGPSSLDTWRFFTNLITDFLISSR
jgi:hypothetical protein